MSSFHLDTKLSSAWENALSVAQLNTSRGKVAGVQQPPTDAASAAAAALSRKRAQQRRQANKDDKEPKVLLCCTLTNPIRKTCIQVVEHTYPFTSTTYLAVQD